MRDRVTSKTIGMLCRFETGEEIGPIDYHLSIDDDNTDVIGVSIGSHCAKTLHELRIAINNEYGCEASIVSLDDEDGHLLVLRDAMLACYPVHFVTDGMLHELDECIAYLYHSPYAFSDRLFWQSASYLIAQSNDLPLMRKAIELYRCGIVQWLSAYYTVEGMRFFDRFPVNGKEVSDANR